MQRANIIRAWAGLGHHIIDLNGLGLGWALSPWAWAGPGWGLLSPWRTLVHGTRRHPPPQRPVGIPHAVLFSLAQIRQKWPSPGTKALKFHLSRVIGDLASVASLPPLFVPSNDAKRSVTLATSAPLILLDRDQWCDRDQ